MNFWDTSAEFGPFPREKRSSLMMSREEATANAEGAEEKTGKSEQRQLFLTCAPVSHSSATEQTGGHRHACELHSIMG